MKPILAIFLLSFVMGVHPPPMNTPMGTGGGAFLTGVFVTGADATDDKNTYAIGLDATGLHNLLQTNHAKGLAAVNVRTYMDGNTRKWAGVWRQGNDANYVSIDLDINAFTQLATTRHGQGLTLIDLETYVDGGQRKWAGVWRAGSDANYFSVDMDFNAFTAMVKKRNGESLVIIDVETYVEGGARKYAGVWRSGTDRNYVDVGLDRAAFDRLADARHKDGLTLIDLEMWDEGNVKKWGGVWRAGTSANYYERFVDDEAMTSSVHARHKQGISLIGLTMCSSNCTTDCMDKAVMPDDPTTAWQDAYDYGITATGTHCEGLPGTCPATPAADAKVYYHWLGEVEGNKRYLRVSATQGSDRFMTMPFSDTAVNPLGMWLYSPGSWHHAIDFLASDKHSFEVKAAAPGKVIHIGWDSWSGNTLIVSHDEGGVTDAYRTIHMHLRNGPANDCSNAWTQTIPTLTGTILAQYEFFLEHSGCPKTGTRNPDPRFWGTNADKIDMSLLGKSVARGQTLAHSGESGPGGCGCTSGNNAAWRWDQSSMNTHLHLFTTRRDPTNAKFYFVDPYGVYSYPSGCYPAKMSDPISSDCSRYPILWRDNPPQRP